MNKTSVIIVCVSAVVLIGCLLAFTSGGKEEVSKIEDELESLRKKVKGLGSDASDELKKALKGLEREFEDLKAKI